MLPLLCFLSWVIVRHHLLFLLFHLCFPLHLFLTHYHSVLFLSSFFNSFLFSPSSISIFTLTGITEHLASSYITAHSFVSFLTSCILRLFPPTFSFYFSYRPRYNTFVSNVRLKIHVSNFSDENYVSNDANAARDFLFEFHVSFLLFPVQTPLCLRWNFCFQAALTIKVLHEVFGQLLVRF